MRLISAGAILGLSTAAAQAAILANPAVLTSATPFSPAFAAGNLFDSNQLTEYASATLGTGTFVSFDFGSPVTLDRYVLITRGNNVDVVGQARLTLSNDPTFATGNTVFNFATSGQNARAPIQTFTATTARYARWDVVTSPGTSQNLGGSEMRFLNTPAGSVIAAVTAYNSSTPFSAQFATANAVNGDAGRGLQAGVEYASASQGVNTFVDFDFGSVRPVSGFDFFDRIPTVDRTTAFNLIFDDDSATFDSPVMSLPFTPGSTVWGYSQNFMPVNARYVRLDVTGSGVNANAGMQEIVFYAAPEPSAAVLAGLTILLPAMRRRRA